MISDIPPFDLALGYELYALLLKPVEAGWKPAKSLIVVTNGALGLLPLSLLPTAPAEIDGERGSAVRRLPQGAVAGAHPCRHHGAVGRRAAHAAALPPGKPARGELIAFGDPYFSKEQQAEREGAGETVQVADVGRPTRRAACR